eukprot:4351977-Heterocapsa_arctica.AAC.1
MLQAHHGGGMGTSKHDGGWHEVERKAKWKDRSTASWGCQCGTDDNYSTRTSCRGCGRRAPTKFVEKVAAAGTKEYSQPTWSQGRSSNKEDSLQKTFDKAKKTILEFEKASGKAKQEAAPVNLHCTNDAEIDRLRSEIEKLQGLGD